MDLFRINTIYDLMCDGLTSDLINDREDEFEPLTFDELFSLLHKYSAHMKEIAELYVRNAEPAYARTNDRINFSMIYRICKAKNNFITLFAFDVDDNYEINLPIFPLTPLSREEMVDIIYERMIDRLRLDIIIDRNEHGLCQLTKRQISESIDNYSEIIRNTAAFFLTKWLDNEKIFFHRMRNICRFQYGKFYLNGEKYPLIISSPLLEDICSRCIKDNKINYSLYLPNALTSKLDSIKI